MIFLLDTDICVYCINNKPLSVRTRLNMLRFGDVGIPAIVVAELRYGIAKSQVREKNEIAVDRFLASFEIVPFDKAAALRYGDIRAELEKKGTPIGALDMLIAAQAVSLGLTLVTNNLREYKRVPGLKCITWA